MIGRWSSKTSGTEEEEPKGFDAFELRLGDLMRGERATMGKSLLDVQRELRIKASYIAAIENSDPDAFDTPGFIAGYVRSYARYLGMDPDESFAKFCRESGFAVAHGMSAEASVIKKPTREDRLEASAAEGDIFARSATPFLPGETSILSQIEPAAIGSAGVLIALIGAIGFGGWTVLKEVQRVQVTPVDQTPVVLSDLDPLNGALSSGPSVDTSTTGLANSTRSDAMDRLYRPQALDVPVLVARDAPISTLDPHQVGVFNDERPAAQGSAIASFDGPVVPQVVEQHAGTVRLIAASESWVRVSSANGTRMFEAMMQPGDVYEVPNTEEAPILRTGNAGALFFETGAGCFGPLGEVGAVTNNLPLAAEPLLALYDQVDPSQDRSLNRMFASVEGNLDPAALAALPCQVR